MTRTTKFEQGFVFCSSSEEDSDPLEEDEGLWFDSSFHRTMPNNHESNQEVGPEENVWESDEDDASLFSSDAEGNDEVSALRAQVQLLMRIVADQKQTYDDLQARVDRLETARRTGSSVYELLAMCGRVVWTFFIQAQVPFLVTNSLLILMRSTNDPQSKFRLRAYLALSAAFVFVRAIFILSWPSLSGGVNQKDTRLYSIALITLLPKELSFAPILAATIAIALLLSVLSMQKLIETEPVKTACYPSDWLLRLSEILRNCVFSYNKWENDTGMFLLGVSTKALRFFDEPPQRHYEEWQNRPVYVQTDKKTN